MHIFSLILAGLILFTAPAHAQERGYIADLLALPAQHTILRLSASESREVEQDLLTANLSFQAKSSDPVALQNIVNTAIDQALKIANSYETVRTQTQHYSIYEYHPDPKQRKIKEWTAEQSLQIKSTTPEDVLKLSGELQTQGLLLQGLSFSVSPAKHEQTKDSLLESALQKLEAKAQRAAKSLGKTQAELLDIQINDNAGANGVNPHIRMRSASMMMAQESISAPSAQAGETRISISVSGNALLKP